MKLLVGFSRPRSGFEPFSWLIRLVEGGWKLQPYSHCFIKFYMPEYDRWVVFQAKGLVSNFISEDNFNKMELTTNLFSVDVGDDTEKSLFQYCIDRVGSHYGVLIALGIGYVEIMQRFGKSVSNPFANDVEDVCSELSARILQDQAHVALNVPLDSIGPKAMFNILTDVIKAPQVSVAGANK